MTHQDITTAAERWVADAVAAHPTDRVKQAILIASEPPSRWDAHERAISDVAFDLVFRYMTDEEAQVWAIYCLDDGVKPMADARMAHRSVQQPTMQVAA